MSKLILINEQLQARIQTKGQNFSSENGFQAQVGAGLA